MSPATAGWPVPIALYLCREYEAAKGATQSYPELSTPYRWLAAALGQTGRIEEAKGALTRAGSFEHGYRGRIFSRERCGRVITFRPMPVEQGDGPDFVVISVSETQDGDEFEIGAA